MIKLKNFKKKMFKLFICSSIRMNLKVRGTSKNGSIRANKSKINESREKLIKELVWTKITTFFKQRVSIIL